MRTKTGNPSFRGHAFGPVHKLINLTSSCRRIGLYKNTEILFYLNTRTYGTGYTFGKKRLKIAGYTSEESIQKAIRRKLAE